MHQVWLNLSQLAIDPLCCPSKTSSWLIFDCQINIQCTGTTSSFLRKTTTKIRTEICKKKYPLLKKWPSSIFNYTPSFAIRSEDEGNNSTWRCCSISEVAENNGSRPFRTFYELYVIPANKV